MITWGPIHITPELSLGNIAILVAFLVWAVKFSGKITLSLNTLEHLDKALNGDGPQDTNAWFYRMSIMERRVTEMWRRLGFQSGKVDVDGNTGYRTRESD